VSVVGDSLARRFTFSIANFLLHTNEDYASVENKTGLHFGYHQSVDWNEHMDELPTKSLVFQWAPFYKNIKRLCVKGYFQDFDVVVIAHGLHDAIKYWGTPLPYKRDFPDNSRHKLDYNRKDMGCFCNTSAARNSLLIWRTAPLMYDPMNVTETNGVNFAVRSFNGFFKRELGELCPVARVADMEAALERRSVGSESLVDSSTHHFGYGARFVELQQVLHEIGCALRLTGRSPTPPTAPNLAP